MLHVSADGAHTLILLDRPHRAHAYDRALLEALDAAVARVATPVMIIGSTGDRAFCAGADLMEMKNADPLSPLDLYSQAVFQRIATAAAVSIAAVQGPAVAGGFELALACDLRVVGPRARFELPETELGLIPSAGGCVRLGRLIGPGRARAVILGGEKVDAPTALTWGIASRSADEPLAAAIAWAREIGKRDPVALRLARQAIDLGSLDFERSAEALLYHRRRS